MPRILPPSPRETSRDRHGRSRVARRRPALESLEARTLLAGDPTVYTVDRTSAVGAGSGVAGDLVYVLGRANADVDPDGSVIRFDPAVFSSHQTIALTSTLNLTAGPIAIEGPGAGLLTVSGGDAVRVFRVDAGVTASMSGLTIADGHDISGAGIHNAGTLTVAQVTFDGNRAVGLGAGDGFGGGISNAGVLTISDAAFVKNSAIGGRADDGWSDGDGYGGAVYNTGTLSMTGGRFDDNLARDGAYMGYGAGGAVFNVGMLAITDVAFNGNSAQGGAPLWFPLRGDGGAIYNSGTATLSRSSLNGNRAINGGGIYNSARLSLFDVSIAGGDAETGGGVYNAGTAMIRGGTISANQVNGTITTKYWDVTDCAGGGIANFGSMTIVNATIAGNTASIRDGRGEKALGGGIANLGTLLLVFTTIADNTADTDGGGVWTSEGQAVTTSGASLFRNANGGNVAVADGGAFRSLGHNLFSDAPAVPLDPTDLVAVDPRLGPLADNGGPTPTMALLAGSPARDAGVALGGVTSDQRGAPRPQGGGPDVGAYEAQDWGTTAFVQIASPSIVYGSTTATLLSGRITAGSLVPPGEVAVTFLGVTRTVAIDPGTGAFAAVFPTAGLHADRSPYAVAYHYAGSGEFLAADATGGLTVTPAPLTVVADDQVVAFGADPPPLTARYLGFVNGEGPESLARPATLTTTAVAYSPPGRYPIVASGAASPDYAVAFVDGALTVAPPTSPRLRRRVAVVTSLYRRALGRSAEPAGLRFWLGRLDAGSRAEDVARRIWSSPEHRAQLRRHADPGIGRPAVSGGRVDAWHGVSRIER